MEQAMLFNHCNCDIYIPRSCISISYQRITGSIETGAGCIIPIPIKITRMQHNPYILELTCQNALTACIGHIYICIYLDDDFTKLLPINQNGILVCSIKGGNI